MITTIKKIIKKNVLLASFLYRIYLEGIFWYRTFLTYVIVFLINLLKKITIHKDIKSVTIYQKRATLSYYGKTFYWDPKDRNSLLGIVFTGSYEQKELLQMMLYIKKGMTVFDIGANYGLHSVVFADQVGQRGKVYNFEPLKHVYKQLQDNIKLNKFENIIAAENVGLSKKPGKAIIYISEALGTGASSMQIRWKGKNVKQICEFTTLDRYVQNAKIPTLDFIKCDVEGAELLVFEGGKKTLETYKPMIFFEAIDNHTKLFGYTLLDEMKYLSRFGYEFFKFEDGKMRKMHDNFTNGNYFAIPKR